MGAANKLIKEFTDAHAEKVDALRNCLKTSVDQNKVNAKAAVLLKTLEEDVKKCQTALNKLKSKKKKKRTKLSTAQSLALFEERKKNFTGFKETTLRIEKGPGEYLNNGPIQVDNRNVTQCSFCEFKNKRQKGQPTCGASACI